VDVYETSICVCVCVIKLAILYYHIHTHTLSLALSNVYDNTCYIKYCAISSYFSEAVDVIIENLRFIDCQEGIKAFIEKRKPKWTHSNKKAH